MVNADIRIRAYQIRIYPGFPSSSLHLCFLGPASGLLAACLCRTKGQAILSNRCISTRQNQKRRMGLGLGLDEYSDASIFSARGVVGH